MKTYDIECVQHQLETQDKVASFTRGASMYPLLRTHRDIVEIQRPTQPLKTGDVVLYRVKNCDKLVLHRIIGMRDNETFIIRGDNTYKKEFVPRDAIIGVMTSLYREGKYIDCATSKWYKSYVKRNKFFYPVRWLWRTKIRAVAGKIKRKFKS